MAERRTMWRRGRALTSFVLVMMAAQFISRTGSTAELLMFGRTWCSWCAAWHKEIGPIFPKTTEGRIAPLREVDMLHPPKSVALAKPIAFAPTFVVVEDGKEVGRITGYPGADFFWGLLADILAKLATK
jgi:hypothetical protein